MKKESWENFKTKVQTREESMKLQEWARKYGYRMPEVSIDKNYIFFIFYESGRCDRLYHGYNGIRIYNNCHFPECNAKDVYGYNGEKDSKYEISKASGYETSDGKIHKTIKEAKEWRDFMQVNDRVNSILGNTRSTPEESLENPDKILVAAELINEWVRFYRNINKTGNN